MLRLFPLFFTLVATVLAGVGVILVLMVPSWNDRAGLFIPGSVGIAVLLSIPISWIIARQILSLTKR